MWKLNNFSSIKKNNKNVESYLDDIISFCVVPDRRTRIGPLDNETVADTVAALARGFSHAEITFPVSQGWCLEFAKLKHESRARKSQRPAIRYDALVSLQSIIIFRSNFIETLIASLHYGSLTEDSKKKHLIKHNLSIIWTNTLTDSLAKYFATKTTNNFIILGRNRVNISTEKNLRWGQEASNLWQWNVFPLIWNFSDFFAWQLSPPWNFFPTCFFSKAFVTRKRVFRYTIHGMWTGI